MDAKKGLIIVILIYFIVLIVSTPIYFHMCYHYQNTVVGFFTTGIIAYALDAIGIVCLMKFGFDYGAFEIMYVVIINFFLFMFFYLIGMSAVYTTVVGVNDIFNIFPI